MHIYFFIRGIQHQVDLWKIYIQSIFWKWKRVNLKTGKEEYSLVQGGLRPTVFGAYEYILPKECLAEFCAIMGIKSNADRGSGCFSDIAIKSRFFTMRKIFGCKKIPKKIFKEAETIPKSIMFSNSWRGLSPMMVKGIAFHLIGIRDDLMGEFKHPIEAPTGFYQEML